MTSTLAVLCFFCLSSVVSHSAAVSGACSDHLCDDAMEHQDIQDQVDMLQYHQSVSSRAQARRPWDKFAAALEKPGTPEPQTKILHIGKTGGNGLEAAWDDGNGGYILVPDKAMILQHNSSYYFMHLRNDGSMPAPPYKDIIFFVRAPVQRYVSAWLSVYRRGCKPEKDLGCEPWAEEEGKFRKEWWPATRASFERFPTPDDLACSLGSKDPDVVAQAKLTMNSLTHVHKDLNWYLGGLEGIQKSLPKVLYVGTTEHFDDSYQNVTSLLLARNSFTQEPPAHAPRAHTSDNIDPKMKSLSRCAVENLRKWYAVDYQIIEFLANHSLLEKSYVDEVNERDAVPPKGQRMQCS